MTTINKFNSGVVLFLTAILLISCGLDDFNLKKLANPTDIVPLVYAPLAYGTFKVDDLLVPPPADNNPIPPGGLTLNPVLLNKMGTSFRTSAIDSVYLVTHFTNETPANIQFELLFFNRGVPVGNRFPPGKILAGAKDFPVKFNLGTDDQINLQNSTDISLNFTLLSPSPGAPILYGAVKGKSFTVKIGFYAPVHLFR